MEIIFENVTKGYGGNTVLSGLSVTVGENEILQVTGASGAGKTTFLRLLMGLEKPDSGRILGAERVSFSAVFQENRLCEQLDVITNLKMVCHGIQREELEQEARRLLPEASALKVPAGELSGGMKRRAAILRAMLAESDIVVLDEPFTGLDRENIGLVNDYICDKRKGRTIVYVSHQEMLEIKENIQVNTLSLSLHTFTKGFNYLS